MDRDALVETYRLLAEGLAWIQTSAGEPSLPEDFKGGVARLEEARDIMRAYVETGDRHAAGG